MAFGRKREPQMSGADYLFAMAHSAADRGQPYANGFAAMVRSAFDDQGMLIREVIARRPLKDHEASPVAIIATAVQAALDQGDREAANEALHVGLSLLAKWPDYLDGFIDGHPELTRRSED